LRIALLQVFLDAVGPECPLSQVGEREGITAAEFCEFSGQLKAGVSRAVIMLEEKGIIRRETDEADSRRQLLFMTEAGRAPL